MMLSYMPKTKDALMPVGDALSIVQSSFARIFKNRIVNVSQHCCILPVPEIIRVNCKPCD